jgi:hypothetical protein
LTLERVVQPACVDGAPVVVLEATVIGRAPSHILSLSDSDSSSSDGVESVVQICCTVETQRFFWDAQLGEYLDAVEDAGYEDIFQIARFDDERLVSFFDMIGMSKIDHCERFRFYLRKMEEVGVIPQGTPQSSGEWIPPNCLFEVTHSTQPRHPLYTPIEKSPQDMAKIVKGTYWKKASVLAGRRRTCLSSVSFPVDLSSHLSRVARTRRRRRRPPRSF